MVNPNNPNSDPDGVPPSDPSPDSSSGDQPPEEGSISDELFDSLSELLGDESDTDEPASLPGSELLGETLDTGEEEQVSLPDLGLWSEEPPTPEQSIVPASSSEENIEEGIEEPTILQSEETTPPIEEPTVLQIGSEETTLPIEDLSPIDNILSAGTPSDSDSIDVPLAAEEETFESIPDPWGDTVEETIFPATIEPEVPQPESTESSLADIEAITSPEPTESTPDAWADSITGEPAPGDLETTEIEEPTVLQTPSFADPSEPSPDPIPPVPMGTESSSFELDVDAEPIIPLESLATGPDSPSPESTDFSDSDLERPSDTAIPGADLTSVAEGSEADVRTEDTPAFGVPLESPITAETSEAETLEEPLIPTSLEGLRDDTDESTREASAPVIPPEPEDAAATAAVSAGIGGLSSSDRDREPVAATPASDAALVGAAAPARSNTGGLGALSDKLPLNRHQAVGLLVALSTLGSITYFGVTDKSQNSSGPALAPPTVTASEDAAPVAKKPNEDKPSDVAKPPAVEEGAAQPKRKEVTPEQPASVPPVVPVPKAKVPAPIAKTPAPAPKATPSQLDISDVPTDHWAHPFVTKLHAEGIIPDYPDGKFQPDKPVTRAELAAQIQRAFVNEPGQRNLTFSDLTPDYWAMGAIEGAVDKKFMSGYSEGDFRPDKLVPRYEVLVALASGLELGIPSDPEASLQRFPDQDQLPDWSKGKIAATTQEKIVVSHPDPEQLNPDANATRAEVAAMIYQSLVKAGRLQPVKSEYVVPSEP